jgi:hypothetical protein
MKNRYFILPIALLLFVSCENDSNTSPFGTTIEVPTEVSSIKEAIKIAQPAPRSSVTTPHSPGTDATTTNR